MNKEELKKIVEDHQHFLNRDVDGWEYMCADLVGRDLTDNDLRNANLSYADLRGALLNYTNLSNANLSYANLRGAEIKHSYFVGANLYSADLRSANLLNTTLVCSDLRFANLHGANLSRADFEYANLDGTLFNDEESFRKGEILSESIVGWKKCVDEVIVQLEIPKGAVVFCINGRKCRTNKAKVVSIVNGGIARSFADSKFFYEVGKEIEIKDFNLMYNVECANGIHFFKDRLDAEKF